MAITLNNIYQDTKHKFSLELIAGKEGLENAVSWVHLIEDVTTTDFIRGSELIVTTGLGVKDDYWLDRFIKDLHAQHAVGLIVNVGEYIKEIPRHTIDYCNNTHFPLFIMPWEIHLVDIMQDYCNRIIHAEQIDINESSAFLNALLTPENSDSYQPFLEQHGYNLRGTYCALIIHQEKEMYAKERDILFKKYRLTATNAINRFFIPFGNVVLGQELIIVFHNITLAEIKKYSETLKLIFKKEYPLDKNRFSVGPIVVDINQLHKSFKKGQAVLRIGNYKSQDLIFYEDIGINKIILAVDDKPVLFDMYRSTIGILEEYDNLHGTDFLNVLRLYLFNNSSIQAVASQTFTHRNTINYRIKKIKELINCELDNTEDIFRFQLSFYIKDILNDSENEV